MPELSSKRYPVWAVMRAVLPLLDVSVINPLFVAASCESQPGPAKRTLTGSCMFDFTEGLD